MANTNPSSSFDLSGRVAIVTGSGRGLGAAIARGLAEAGASVMLCSRSEAELERTKSEITRGGGKAHMIVADTSDRASCQRLTDSTVGHFGRVDVLVNNAGIDAIHPAEELTDEDWDRVMNTNLKGYFICSQVVARQMLAQGTGGSIINNSSICSVIRVNAIAPGYFNNIMQDATAEHDRSDKQKQVIAFTPMRRRGRPEELIGPVVFLASDASSYVTGAILFVDGGYTAQ